MTPGDQLKKYLDSFSQYDDDGVVVTDQGVVQLLDSHPDAPKGDGVWAVFPRDDGTFKFGLRRTL